MGLLYMVNFNLHGDHVPSTVSVVEPETMTEVAQVETGVIRRLSRGAGRTPALLRGDDGRGSVWKRADEAP